MIDFIYGKLVLKNNQSIVLESSGIGWKIYLSKSSLKKVPRLNDNLRVWVHIELSKDGRFYAYGFMSEKEKALFEALNNVAGVGPKTAMSVLDTAPVERLQAAIASGNEALLMKVSGIGAKTAQRIILELKNKFQQDRLREATIAADVDAENALVSLGYSRREAKEALLRVADSIDSAEERLKEALKILAKRA
ncbi:MAG: Holliday junction branch migration protein RuvA [Candidatus Paceibacteria bacterium]